MFNSTQEFYKSRTWETFRQNLILKRNLEKGFIECCRCGKKIVKKYDLILHHKTPLNVMNVNDYTVSLNEDNIEFICFRDHNKEHNRFNGQIKNSDKKVYIVYGAPCSGKSTFVKENMEAGDLVVDIDRMWEAISYQPMYMKPNELKENMFILHQHLLEQVKNRMIGKWTTAWVIGGYPNLMDRTRLANELKAELVYIESTKEECLERLNKDVSRAMFRNEWNTYINEWYNKFNE